MRRWLVEETGEIRPPKQGEYYRYNNFVFGLAALDYLDSFPIVRITEISEEIPWSPWIDERTPLTDRFDEWNW